MIAAIETPMDRRQRILRERAVRIARRADEHTAGDQLDILAFRLLSKNYAIEMQFLREVLPLRNLAAIPCTPAFYLGVINIRGELCPVIDLRQLFGHSNRGIANVNRVLVARGAGVDMGILADEIIGIRSVDSDQLRPLAGVAFTLHDEFLRGYMPDDIILLDVARILAHPKLVVNQQVEG